MGKQNLNLAVIEMRKALDTVKTAESCLEAEAGNYEHWKRLSKIENDIAKALAKMEIDERFTEIEG